MSGMTKPAPALSGIMTSIRGSVSTELAVELPNDVVHEGWLLKKKRKKLQGYARRYFILRNNGTLSYSVDRGQESRDQILLNNAAFSSSPSNRSIHVDSGTATFHLRALTEADYQRWMAALRTFITMPRPMSAVDPTFRQSVNYAHTVNFNIGHATKMNTLLDEMGKTLKDLQDAAQALNDVTTSSVRSKHKDASKDAVFFGLFSKPKPPKGKEESEDAASTKSDKHSVNPPEEKFPCTPAGILTGLGSLEKQHKQLITTFNSLLHLDNVASPTRVFSPVMPSTGDWGAIRIPSRANSRATRRAMSTGTVSDDDLQWFDADDGPEEYVIEEPEVDEHPVASDVESVEDKGYETPEAEGTEAEPEPKPVKPPIRRRTHLPAPITGDEMSLLAVLRKNVGKDLSQIALPVGFNEPISMLQRLAEDLEYSSLLSQAVEAQDSIQRLCLITAFAVSGYACTQLRAARKPFMPMLAETYEFEHDNFKFVSEKVCHVPPVMACHASGEGWTYEAVTQAKQKFWGRSLEIIPVGTTTLKIGNDVFTWQKPSSFMRNVVAGTKYLEHVGTMQIHNTTTGERCDVEFKESGMWGASNIVNATVYNARNRAVERITGKWSESLAQAIGRNQLEILWRANDLPPTAQDYYGFTYFTMMLNEFSEDLKDGKGGKWKVPVTDSRWRPDQRALEEGRIDEADELKMKVEETQRVRRRAGKDAKPRWFKKVGEDDTAWVYSGGYWEMRDQGWSQDIQALW